MARSDEEERKADGAGGWRVEGARGENGPRFRPSKSKAFWLVFAGALAVNWYVFSTASKEPAPVSVPYSFFHAQVERGNVESITTAGRTIDGVFERATRVPESAQPQRDFQTRLPDFVSEDLEFLLDHGVVISSETPQGPSILLTVLLGFGPTLLLVALLLFLLTRMSGRGGGLTAFTRSRARRYLQPDSPTTFADVAGIDEAKDELVEIVDFLRNPERYRRLGGAIPKGVLLFGPPGTGKTLLARAVAGEAGVPFFSLSASEFVEILAGAGASRVRDLFKTAREEAPAIIYIDELDAIGKHRSGGTVTGGTDEREQTLNQILTEMDGFSPAEGVVVIASTNRPDTLDSALLRPGRFDRRVAVSAPDIKGRQAILEVHTRAVPLAEDVDLRLIAADTPGMSGADLRNLVNEAALTAARKGHERVGPVDFADALERIILGAERRLTLSREERERTAYHEAGHALVGMLQPGGDPVRKATIIPRGRALGVTLQRPDVDRYGYTAEFLKGRLATALAGRAAEELVFGNVTTSPEGDIELVTQLARQMVGRWGMSDAIGPVAVIPEVTEAGYFLSSDAPSERTRELMDAEIRRLIEDCYETALEQLRSHREQLEWLATALLDRETLDEAEIYAVAGVTREVTREIVEELGEPA
jgi:cell division protease FtsH